MEKKPVHLIMVTAQNNNKFYDMIPKGDIIEVKHGRVDSTCITITKPMKDWDKIYNSKIKKGYVDKSNLVADLVEKVVEKKDFEYKPIPNKIIADIVERLQNYAKKAITANYNIKASQVTQSMVDEAQSILVKLVKCKTINSFNDTLLELYASIPRKMRNVSDYLAKDLNDFGKIIDNEQNLLDVMKGQVVQVQLNMDTEDKEEEYKNNCTILEAMGLEFEEVTDKDVALIKKELGDCSDKYQAAWKVKNIKTQEKFDKYCKENGLKKKDIKLLWHGTRSENVWNIMKTGLVLKPTNAVITGKMFGYGCYFAPKASKSLGYTSLNGSYWTGGSSNSGFMILHDVAYGKAYDVYSFDSKYYDFTYDKLQNACPGANSLHAHAGSMLRNDEIIVYKEEQMTAKYIVELK